MTDHYAVIGNPIGHTKSPLIHTTFAQQTAQDLVYTAIEAPLDGFKASAETFRASGGRGMNVTAPFKLDALSWATVRQQRAALAGASNALKFENDQIVAENFDGVGLVNDIQRNLGFEIRGRRVLLMGAGGAARGAALPILEQRPAELVIVNRTMSRAVALRDQSSQYGHVVAAGYPGVVGNAFDVVLNATSASLRGELPPIDESVFGKDCLAYEFVYGKGLTPFLSLAKRAGVNRLADGVGMLVEQAAEAFFWWRGVRPDTRSMIERIKVPFI
jgi:shikimate dehydrogenase